MTKVEKRIIEFRDWELSNTGSFRFLRIKNCEREKTERKRGTERERERDVDRKVKNKQT